MAGSIPEDFIREIVEHYLRSSLILIFEGFPQEKCA